MVVSVVVVAAATLGSPHSRDLYEMIEGLRWEPAVDEMVFSQLEAMQFPTECTNGRSVGRWVAESVDSVALSIYRCLYAYVSPS